MIEVWFGTGCGLSDVATCFVVLMIWQQRTSYVKMCICVHIYFAMEVAVLIEKIHFAAFHFCLQLLH